MNSLLAVVGTKLRLSTYSVSVRSQLSIFCSRISNMRRAEYRAAVGPIPAPRPARTCNKPSNKYFIRGASHHATNLYKHIETGLKIFSLLGKKEHF